MNVIILFLQSLYFILEAAKIKETCNYIIPENGYLRKILDTFAPVRCRNIWIQRFFFPFYWPCSQVLPH